MSNRIPYPDYKIIRCGCKVAWRYYDNEADAKTAADAASHNAEIDAGLGYDFGFQSPGTIRAPEPGGKVYHPDLWEVCCP